MRQWGTCLFGQVCALHRKILRSLDRPDAATRPRVRWSPIRGSDDVRPHRRLSWTGARAWVLFPRSRAPSSCRCLRAKRDIRLPVHSGWHARVGVRTLQRQLPMRQHASRMRKPSERHTGVPLLAGRTGGCHFGAAIGQRPILPAPEAAVHHVPGRARF